MVMDSLADTMLPAPEVAVPNDDIYPVFIQPVPLQNDDDLQAVIDGLAKVREQSIETYFDNEAALDMAEQNFDRQVEQGYWDRMYALSSGEITTDQLYTQGQRLSAVTPDRADPDEQAYWNDMWLQSDWAQPEPQAQFQQMQYEVPTARQQEDLAQ